MADGAHPLLNYEIVRSVRLRKTCLFLLLAAALGADLALARQVRLRQLVQEDSRVVFELAASWSAPLPRRGEVLDADGLQALTQGGLFERTETLHLNTLEQPSVRVMSADFDEVSATVRSGVVHPVGSQPVEVVGLGWYRKAPVATLVLRTVTLDGTTIRRYRRLLVEVTWADRPVVMIKPADGNPHLNVKESVLATGTVFKIPIRREGIYQIDRTFLDALPDLEMDPGSIDPQDVKVFGNGGMPLPALNSDARPADLVEAQVFVQGGGDGSFDSGDAVWFYGTGPSGWRSVHLRDNWGELRYDDAGSPVVEWQHYVHPFSNENYYFIKIDRQKSAELIQEAYPDMADATEMTQVLGRHFVDFDEFLWAQGHETGHTWVSHRLVDTGTTLTALDNVLLPGLLGGTVAYHARPVIRSNPAASVLFRSGGTTLASVNFGAVSSGVTAPVGRTGVATFEQSVAAGAPLSITMEINPISGGPQAALDWLRVYYPMVPVRSEEPMRLHTPLKTAGAFTFTLQGFATEPYVLDVTIPGAYRWLGTRRVDADYRIQVAAHDALVPRELIAFDAGHVSALVASEVCPAEVGCRIATQNLHGITRYPDFVIITPSEFAAMAEKLAEMRRSDGLTVEVVDIREIYNEFSGGLQDIRAIRDYLKFLYDRASGEESLLRYVLFFGDGHYNYRSINISEDVLPNWIPPFETEESFVPETSYTTDDYFGLLDDNEGLWPFARTGFHGPREHLNERVDVGIGRLTVTTLQEAQAVLEKIRHYENPGSYGPWRKRYLFLADDGPTGSSGTQDDKDLHTQNTDVVANMVEQVAPYIDPIKVYGISYPREFLNGWRIPRARQDILTALNNGVLVFNFSGHGGEYGLAQEDLFNADDAAALTNYDALPIFITATCSFGRWDQSDEQSGAEVLLLNDQGGAIALLTTVRTVYTSGDASSLNVGLNVALNQELFRRDADGQLPRLGDALLRTKNTRVGYEGNNRKFNLLGDPSMRVGVPAPHVVVESINGNDVTQEVTDIKALQRVTLQGRIETVDRQFDAAFEGVVSVTVFDAERHVIIPPDVLRHMPTPYYRVREDLLWAGRTKVKEGRFAATFVVPKDISYSNKPGRISVYAAGSQGHAQGHTDNIIVGGTAAEVPDDDTGPVIELYLGDESFPDGGLTSSMPELLAKIFDQSGVNTVGAGMGHEMLLVLDENEEDAVNVGALYESEENSYQRGSVRYKFNDPLASGTHTLSMRAWDVLNNSGTSTLTFVVADEAQLVVRNVFNYPNPTTGPTRFVFEHNQVPGAPVHVRVRIYSLSGRPVRTIEVDDMLSGGAMQIPWDGTDDDYARLPSGVYLYKVRVEVEGGSSEQQVSEAIEKLTIVR